YLLENDLSENLILVDSTAEALRMIAADLYDFAVLPQLPGQYWRKQLNLDNLAMSKAPLYPRELCAAVREGSSHQLRRLGEALATLKRNGVYQGLSDRWFETLRPNGLSVRLMTERVFLVLLPIAAIMIGWGLWTRSLRREVAVQTRELNRQLGERRRVENALRDHEQRLRERNAFIETVLGRLPEGVAVSRISDGTVEYINSAFRSIYGLGATMFPSFDTMLTLMHPDGTGSDEFNRQLSHACASTGGEILRLHRQDITTPSGSRRVVTASFMPLAEQDLLVTVARDITDATIAERAVIESEERYRTLTANIPVGLFRISGQGKIISVNPALVRMLGYDTAEELSRVSADDFFCDRDQREQLLSRLASDHFVKDCEIRALRKDGAVVWLSHSVRAIVDETDRILFADGVVEDITERRNAQEALQTSERKYRGLFTGMINAFVLWEAVLGDNGRLADCKIIEANPAFARIVGEVNTPLEGRSLLDLYPQTEREWLDALDQVVMTGESQSFEKYHRSTGRFFATHCFRSDIQPNRYGMLLHDVTERKRAEQALVHSEERFRTVIDTARDAIFIKDANRVYISVNPSMAEIFSRTVASIIGLTDRDLFGAETSDEIEAADMLVLAGETVDRETVYPKLGYHRTFHVVKVPMRNVDGTVIGICGIARDVTEMKRLQEFSERAQRLETAGRIAGQVAHDFNNLLGPLLAYPDFIRDELPTNHVTLPIIADMERAAKQMAEINQQLLTLGRRGHYSLEQLDLNEQVAQALDRMRDRAQHVSIRTSLSPNLLHVKGGGAQLQRVVANLIANAFDAMQERGQLLITTENYYVDVPNNGRDRIPQGEYVKLTVADSGCGIPEEVLPRMYDPFFTTKPSDRKRGSGLGLSVVHTVIEDHGGIVDCQSKIGEGTSMFVYLPVSRERVPAIDDGTIAGGTATERILVVDDDQVQREVTGRLLKKLGYSYRTVASGEAALDILHSEQFDLLILDMIMPGGVDGTETYRLAKRRVPHQRAIIVSGYAESERVNEALRLGAGMFVRKPLTIKSLAGAVRRELDRRVDTPTGT
ncbi:MAG: PAS domain S-box protein, partial [candidate division Zixibacteria bacterium]|nr:PAS domain S-box protein [candidate division Zixibacteria bacterium]